MNKKICRPPATGVENMPLMPLGMSANFRFSDTDRNPGNRKYSGTMYPRVAYMQMRPCFSSLALRRLNLVMSPSLESPIGSQ
eukprot:3233149-Pyramimonas_sp.AAC.1